MMESIERPTKLRKLSHGQPGEHDVASMMTGSTTQSAVDSGSLHHAQHNQSEPTVLATNNVAVTEEQESQDTTDLGRSEFKSEAPRLTQPLSKNQLKKQRKKEEWEAGKDWRKARQKEKDAEKKAKKRELKLKEQAERLAQGLKPEPEPRTRYRRPTLLPVTFLIDCGFDDKMLEKERISLGAQVTRAYSDNSRAPFQSHLVVSSWGGLLKDRFDTVLRKAYRNWRGVQFTDKDFAAAAEIAKSNMTGERGGKLAGTFQKYVMTDSPKQETESTTSLKGYDAKVEPVQALPEVEAHEKEISGGQNTTQTTDAAPAEKYVGQPEDAALKQQGEVIYLTSDSPDTLTELKPYSTYIIGGLVDKNRHKGICYKTACERGIKTAKLPIGQYMEMQSRFVLATNHVVEIMVYWLECGDWGEAFMKAIPKRKGGKLRNGKGSFQPSAEDEKGADELDGGESDDYDDDGNASQLESSEHRLEAEDGQLSTAVASAAASTNA